MVRQTNNTSALSDAIAQGALVSTSPTNVDLPIFKYLQTGKNTTKANPAEFDIEVPRGIIKRVWVEFPSGCVGLVGVQLYHLQQQIFPMPDGEWIRSNNSVMNFALTFRISAEPPMLRARVYNLDDTFDHTPWIAVEMNAAVTEIPESMKQFMDTLR